MPVPRHLPRKAGRLRHLLANQGVPIITPKKDIYRVKRGGRKLFVLLAYIRLYGTFLLA
jgi:hypothetical protein